MSTSSRYACRARPGVARTGTTVSSRAASALRTLLLAMKYATLGAARSTPVNRGSPAACRAPR